MTAAPSAPLPGGLLSHLAAHPVPAEEVRFAVVLNGGVSLAVQNLFNEDYVTYSSDTSNPTDNLRYFAGRGRSFTLGWDRRF